jgi:CubicO group peptidase (beta-lactamase class C family)
MSLRQVLRVGSIALLLGGSLAAQPPVPADIDAYVERALKTFDSPGLSVAVVKDGKMVFAKGYGVRRLGQPARVDERTLFQIGSTTKAFTAAALATLVDEGKLAWDEPVRTYLPWFQMYDPYVSKEITTRDLLSHRSGLGLGEGDLLMFPESDYSRRELVSRMKFMPPVSSFRSRWAYCNLCFLAASELIPAQGGQSWEDYVKALLSNLAS